MPSPIGYDPYVDESPATFHNPYPTFVTNPYPYLDECASQHEPSWPPQSYYPDAGIGHNPPTYLQATPSHYPSPHHQATTPIHPCQSHYPRPFTTCHLQQHTQQPRQCFPIGKFFVTVVKARDIKGDEFLNFGKADPYGVIKLGGKDYGDERWTEICKDQGSSPVWNQVFSFFIRKEDVEYNDLTISLVNKNKFFRRDNLLGQLRITNMGPYVTGLQNNVPEQWYPVIYKGVPRGEILLVFNFIRMPAEEMLTSTDIRTGAEWKPLDYRDPNAKAKWTTSAEVATGVLQVILAAAAIALPFI